MTDPRQDWHEDLVVEFRWASDEASSIDGFVEALNAAVAQWGLKVSRHGTKRAMRTALIEEQRWLDEQKQRLGLE